MSYIGNTPFTAAFLVDTFSGNGSTVAFTMSVAPANTSSILVAVTGVVQDPSTYSVSGTTLTFSAAPPSGTSNISVRYLGIPANGVTTTAYRTQTEFTATAGQTTFTVPSYTVGYIDVYRNGLLLGSADFTATTGTTVVLANACAAGDFVETVSFYVSSVLNAIPATAGSVAASYLAPGAARSNFGAGAVLQVVNATFGTQTSTTSTSYGDTGLTASITPTSSSSKILVIANITGIAVINNQTAIRLRLNRGSTGLIEFEREAGYIGTLSTELAVGGSGTSYLDSPATTSSTTYKVQFQSLNGNAVFIATSSSICTITLMEIAA